MSRLLLCLALSVPLASAHRPESAQEYLEIDKPTISYVIAGTFEVGTEVFTLSLAYEQPFALPFEVMVPVRIRVVTRCRSRVGHPHRQTELDQRLQGAVHGGPGNCR